MQRVRIKICGITRVQDALHAVNAGADAIGLVFYPPSPRNVEVDIARKICTALPPFVSVVGLFVNEQRERVDEICNAIPLSLIQFHGDESEADCTRYKLPYIKAIRVRSSCDVINAEQQFFSAQALLVDAFKEGVPGGTGETFDWSLLPSSRLKPLVLAGGLNPDNVRSAIQSVRPYAVDVSGGVEVKKGIKDHAKISRFINEVSLGYQE